MTISPTLVATLTLALAAPAVAGVGLSLALPADATVTASAYSCAGAEPITVRYINAGDNSLAILPVEGEERIFVNVVSGSGARYASGNLVWWSKGDSGSLEDTLTGAPAVECSAVTP